MDNKEILIVSTACDEFQNEYKLEGQCVTGFDWLSGDDVCAFTAYGSLKWQDVA